jgi:hypothetical protein
MRVALTDGSGLTARQVAGQLAGLGHRVEVLSPDPLCLSRWTRSVHRVRPVPAYGTAPRVWLRAALDICQTNGIDVLFPTQEQVAVLSACAGEVRAANVRTVVPRFAALVRVQDKLAAYATLRAADLPQPDATILAGRTEVESWDRFPVYMKLPIGTATSGVRLVREAAQLRSVVTDAIAAGAFDDGGILAQAPTEGPLVMVQAVFADGELVAFHANERVRLGSMGGASHKRSVDLPAARDHMRTLGRHLRWHGAISADAIVTPSGPRYIDINPRLVEPANARRSGVDLVSPMLELATGDLPAVQAPGRVGVDTHQLLIAVLGAAQRTGRRRAVVQELVDAARHRHGYAGSSEELTPVRGDWRAAVPVVVAAAATVARPALWHRFASGSVQNYSLTAAGWRQLRAPTPGEVPPGGSPA